MMRKSSHVKLKLISVGISTKVKSSCKVTECSCPRCIECCWHNPGWFGTIREVKGAAKIMGMDIIDFAREYLIQEWWAGEDEIFIPAPRRDLTRFRSDMLFGPMPELTKYDLENGKGFVRASWGHNFLRGFACIFLSSNNKCLIHLSKPKECRETFGCGSGHFKGRHSLLSYWCKHQDFIKALVDG
jgi:Fe-S-cluster containining protein